MDNLARVQIDLDIAAQKVVHHLMLHNETIEQQTTEQLELAIKDICSGDNLARLVRERVDSELRGEVFRRVKELTDEAIRVYTDKIAERIAANVEQALGNC